MLRSNYVSSHHPQPDLKVKFPSRRGAPWTVRELRLLGKVPDSALARRTGRTIKETVAMREGRRIALPTAPRRASVGAHY